uniref:NUC173 domain-containing protein n=1 Tax=Angiostrongylus cantonensis TaxID=6313 RepID=A0A0K0DAM2_ANGCA
MVGKYRHRIHKMTKIRIKKGMSSESNPTKHRHREAAGAARARSLSTGMMEAVDDRPEAAHHLLDKLVGLWLTRRMSIGREQDFSNKSMVSDGAVSRISQFTACTNQSFDSVHRLWKSGSPMQKEVVVVLAAVAELIKEHNGSETDVEYFAALLTTLEGSSTSEPCRTAAISFLLQLIVKKVSKDVLQSKFARTVQVLYTKILENSENPEGSALKYLLSVLGVVLRAQPAYVWNAANTKNILVSVAALCVHEKPWVRTMARRVVRAVLTDPVTAMDNGLHAASPSVGTFVQQHLQAASGDMAAIRYLCLLEGIMHKMPSSLFKQLAEIILRSLAVADQMVKCSALQCLHRCLQRQPCDAALSVEVNVLLVKALRELCPPSEDVTVCAYWMQALAETHVCLTAKDPNSRIDFFIKRFSVVKLFDTGNEQLAQVTYQVYGTFFFGIVLCRIMRTVRKFFSHFWIRSEMRLFEVAGIGITGDEFCKAMQTLALLREGNDSFCRQELDFTVGCAVRHVGAPAVLSAIPLGIDTDAAILDIEFTRSWMIPILRVNLHNAPLEFFSSYFLPLAMKIHRYFSVLLLIVVIFSQLWELLPSFCDSPSDIEKSFPQLAPVLGAALNERPDLRPSILSALRRISRFCLLPDAFPERVEVVSAYAKNFMPLLFNLYTTTSSDDSADKGPRMAILETIRAYADLTPKRLVAQFVDAAITKANDAFDDASRQARILDILCAIVRNADCTTLGKVMDTINPWFAINEVQKKAFRILEEISNKRISPELEPFFLSRSTDFVNSLLRPIDTVVPPARAAFCACIQSVVDSMDDLPKLSDFCLKSLDAVVLTLDKSNSTHARSNASKCLQHMFNKLIQVGGEIDQHPSAVVNDLLSRMYELMVPVDSCDNGTVDLCTARSTLVALNIIAQKQLRILNGGHISRLIAHGCAWIGDGRPPVRILVIRLLRVLTKKLPEYALQQYRDLLLSSIFDGQPTCDVTSKVRKANRLLLEVLVARFGIDILLKYTSKLDWVKQMKNIGKLTKRKERQLSEGPAKKDSDDGSISGTDSRLTSRTAGADTILKLLENSDASESEGEERLAEMRSRTGSVWLKEDTDMGDSTDLLDRKKMILKVTTCDPAKQHKKIVERRNNSDFGFKTSNDGRLIIGNSVLSGSRASSWRTGTTQGIHRETSLRNGKIRHSKGKNAKNKKLQPYAYIPLRRKGVKQVHNCCYFH